MENRLKPVLTDILGEPISANKLSRLTGISVRTATSFLNNPNYFPTYKTAEAVCRTFSIQPGHFLFFRASGEEG